MKWILSEHYCFYMSFLVDRILRNIHLTKMVGIKSKPLIQKLNKTFDMRHLFWILIGLSNVLLVLFIQFSCMKWEINEFDLLWFFCQYHGWQSLVWLFLFNWKWFFNHLPRFFGVCPSLYFNPLHWHLSFRSNLIIYGFFP